MNVFRAFLLTALVLATAGSAHAFLGLFSQNDRLTPENGQVRISLSRISDGKAHHFSFEDQGVELKFFVLKSSDGVIRAAFDACDVCFREKKGYSQDKDFMVCNNCGMRFHSSRINEVEGGCNPSPLARGIDGDELVIATSDLIAGKRFFK
ncbi:MAG: Fe-S-containing protein [Desulfomicrobium sp.]